MGFIEKLPHSLVKAFRSTLEEVRDADLLVQVVDVSDEFYRQHMEVTGQTLQELEESLTDCVSSAWSPGPGTPTPVLFSAQK